jgi:endonuclease YncB( thermonuclease family)
LLFTVVPRINIGTQKRKGLVMAEFTVVSIIDGDTFDVSPGWTWEGQSGTRVRPTGFDAPEIATRGGAGAKAQLSQLILRQRVKLGNA